jgi:hypothetical protein
VALEDTAKTLIAQFGRKASLVQPSLTPADPNAPWDNAGSETTTSVDMCFVGYGAAQNAPNLDTGEQVTALIAGLDVADLTTKDKVIDGSNTYRITAVERVNPGSVNYLWKATLQR